jgi:hypothetical protein
MTRATMRALLRRQVQEPTTGGEWTDAELNDALNSALVAFESEIIKAAPGAFIDYHKADLIANERWYDIPNMAWRVDRVFRLSTSGDYVPIAHEKNSILDDVEGGLRDALDHACYSVDGRFVRLYPEPTANLTDGLRMRIIPLLAMDLDTDTPGIHQGLHPGIPLLAKLLLLEETGEPANQTLERLKFLFWDRIPDLYASLDNTPDFFEPQVDKGSFGTLGGF